MKRANGLFALGAAFMAIGIGAAASHQPALLAFTGVGACFIALGGKARRDGRS